MNFLDKTGLEHLWAQIVSKLGRKVDKEDGKGLSSNDYTSTEKNKLAGIAAGANNYSHPTTSGNKHIPSGGATGQILKWSADGTAVWGSDNNTTYNDMVGAASNAAGTHGLVPAPAKGDQGKYLRGDGTWSTPASSSTVPTNHASAQTTYGISSATQYGHAKASNTTPFANGTAKVGDETSTFARGDHVHPVQTTITGNAGSATKLQNSRKISVGNLSKNFDGSSDISFPIASIGAFSISTRGTKIESGTDLDTILSWGNYYVADDNIAQSIVNGPPTTHGYRLICQASYLNNIKNYGYQIAFLRSGEVYIRCCNVSDSTWSSWYTCSKSNHTHTLSSLGISSGTSLNSAPSNPSPGDIFFLY